MGHDEIKNNPPPPAAAASPSLEREVHQLKNEMIEMKEQQATILQSLSKYQEILDLVLGMMASVEFKRGGGGGRGDPKKFKQPPSDEFRQPPSDDTIIL